MGFFDPNELELADFRPGVKSWAHLGDQLTLAVMSLEPGLSDPGHEHPFEQAGLVLAGRFELTIGPETRTLSAGQGYLVPAGVRHGWRVIAGPVTVLDVSARVPAGEV